MLDKLKKSGTEALGAASEAARQVQAKVGPIVQDVQSKVAPLVKDVQDKVAPLVSKVGNVEQALDLPQRQRHVELVRRGFNTFVHGMARATRELKEEQRATTAATADVATNAEGEILLGPGPAEEAAAEGPLQNLTPEELQELQAAEAAAREKEAATRLADDEQFAKNFARLFLDMGGIFPKLAQVLSLRSDLIKNPVVLQRLRAVQEECKRMPFDEAVALASRESAPFREGKYELKDWPKYIHAGSIAQVAPFVFADRQGPPGEAAIVEARVPDGVVKLTFQKMREVMEIDFRLLRSQLRWMERTGKWTKGMQGWGKLTPKNLQKIKEVWRVMVDLEEEVLAEFDLTLEAELQQKGSEVIGRVLGPSGGACSWLDSWREEALMTALEPAGPAAVREAQKAWTNAAQCADSGWATSLARRAYAGKELADNMAAGERHLARLRRSLQSLQVRVPEVFVDASGPQVLAMGMAPGPSLKNMLDVVTGEDAEAAQEAAAWFAAVLLFIIVPLWGRMLLVEGCCHADPHPGNFKVQGLPGRLGEQDAPSSPAPPELPDAPPPERPQRRGGLSWFCCSGGAAAAAAPPKPQQTDKLTLWVLDWGSCADLEEPTRLVLCRLILALSELRAVERQATQAEDGARARAERKAAVCMRALGVEATEEEGKDAFLAALGMCLFDPAISKTHPLLAGDRVEELGQRIPAKGGLGKVLRVVAILVGISRELETKLNEKAADSLPNGNSSGGSTGAAGAGGVGPPFVDLFLVELWRPFAAEGLASAPTDGGWEEAPATNDV